MSMVQASYDPDNIFAKILRGEIPCHKVLETDDCLVFMDIMPIVDGHCLVIPKAPARSIFDVPPDVFAAMAVTAQRVAKAACKAFNADGHTLKQYSEPAGGQEVFHIHFHILPRHLGVATRPRKMADHAILADHAKRIAAALD